MSHVFTLVLAEVSHGCVLINGDSLFRTLAGPSQSSGHRQRNRNRVGMGWQAHAVIAGLIAYQDPQSSRPRTGIRGQLQMQGEVGRPCKKSYRLLKERIGENLRLSLFDADQIGG